MKTGCVSTLEIVQNKLVAEWQEQHNKNMDYFEVNGIPANAKALHSDLTLLKEHGMDIITIPDRPNKYFCSARLLDIP